MPHNGTNLTRTFLTSTTLFYLHVLDGEGELWAHVWNQHFRKKRPKRSAVFNFLSYFAAGNRHKFDENQGESCADDSVATSATHAARAVATTAASVASNAATAAKSAIQPKQAKVTNNEKTLLLSSDDEFQ